MSEQFVRECTVGTVAEKDYSDTDTEGAFQTNHLVR